MKIKVYDWVRNNKIVLSLITVAVVVFVVFVVLFRMYIVDSNSNWIGFWGSIIGSFFGVGGVFATMRWDQKKREDERRQDIFISNLSTYTGLVQTLGSTKFSSIYEELLELKNSKEWHVLNNETKISIEKILALLPKVDEKNGLQNMISKYIQINLRPEFEIQIKDSYYDPETEDSTMLELEIIHQQAVDELSSLLAERIEYSISYIESMKYILGTTYEFKRAMRSMPTLKDFAHKSDTIYSSLLELNYSNTWNDYQVGREDMYNSVKTLKNSLEKQIADLHN